MLLSRGRFDVISEDVTAQTTVRSRLLLVDDEPNTLQALRRMFRHEPYELLLASGGEEGLAILSHHEVGVIISDYRMPGMNGVDFLRQVKTRWPDTLRIVLSGFTDLRSVTSAINEGAVYKFLTKPWNDEELREITREAFSLYELQRENRRLNAELREANAELASLNQALERRVEEKTRHLEIHAASLRISHEMLDRLPVAALGIDPDGIVAYANEEAMRLFSASPGAALVGTSLAQCAAALSDSLRASSEAFFTQALELAGIGPVAAQVRRMGRSSASQGWIVTLIRQEGHHDAD